MTDHEMRVAISEACGWDASWVDPLSNLSLMHEAEKVLDENQWEDYFNHISDVVARDWPDDYYGKCIHATAKQRAEAFCRTLFPERFKE